MYKGSAVFLIYFFKSNLQEVRQTQQVQEVQSLLCHPGG